jgi:hypothetical protein
MHVVQDARALAQDREVGNLQRGFLPVFHQVDTRNRHQQAMKLMVVEEKFCTKAELALNDFGGC